MKEATRTFSYTAQRWDYITTICAIAFLFLTDGGFLALLIFLLIHNGLLRLVVLAIVTVSYLLFITVLLAPLWTQHRLSATHLQLHYGLSLNITIPRGTIIAAQAVRERLTMLEPMQASYDAKKSRIVASFSDKGQVLLHLDGTNTYKVGRSTVLADTILINVDARDEFLADLNMPRILKSPSPGDLPVRQVATQVLPPTPGNTASPTAVAIRVVGLTRGFNSLIAVDNLHMSVRQGEIYGFLGSNGAGKTTTIKMLVGLLQPDAGHAWVAGHNVWVEPLAAKAAFGYVADRSILYERLTGREFLAFLGQLRGLPQTEAEKRIEDLLDITELTEHADRLCGSYSFGMKRKLSLAGALLHQPQVLILDEPLSGLDPRSARRLKDLFIELAAGGVTVLLSTHDLATAGAVCHRIAIIHRGRLLVEGSPSELSQAATAANLEAVFLNLTADQQQDQLLSASSEK